MNQKQGSQVALKTLASVEMQVARLGCQLLNKPLNLLPQFPPCKTMPICWDNIKSEQSLQRVFVGGGGGQEGSGRWPGALLPPNVTLPGTVPGVLRRKPGFWGQRPASSGPSEVQLLGAQHWLSSVRNYLRLPRVIIIREMMGVI